MLHHYQHLRYLLLLISFINLSSSLNPIIIKGSKLFDSITRYQFYIKGLAYQPRNEGLIDPLSNIEGCQRDVPQFSKLGINVLRVYETHLNKNHDPCMKLLEQAGIYVLLDLPTKNKSINRLDPHYDVDLFDHYVNKVKAFQNYTNVLGFIAGNEIINSIETTRAAAYVKAAIRDTKAYIKSQGLHFPVGYADIDLEVVRLNNQDYFNCGDSEEDTADFYAINTYRWCGKSSLKKSGYHHFINELMDYNKPTFFSEFGCINHPPRLFNEIDAIYSDPLQDILSGGIVYEYSQESNRYGLVKIHHQNQSLDLLPEFSAVRSYMTKIQPTRIWMDDYHPTNLEPRECPEISEDWLSNSELPNSPHPSICQQLFLNLSCILTDELKVNNNQSLTATIDDLCSTISCTQIQSNSELGAYGKYSTCPNYIKYSWVFNQAYLEGYGCEFDNLSKLIP